MVLVLREYVGSERAQALASGARRSSASDLDLLGVDTDGAGIGLAFELVLDDGGDIGFALALGWVEAPA